MKHLFLSVFYLCTLVVSFGQNQNYQVNFLKGSRIFEPNLTEFTSINDLDQNEIFNNYFYRYLQFNNIPDNNLLTEISNHGITLLEYIPNNTYLAAIPLNIDFNLFQTLNVRSIQSVETYDKTGPILERGVYPVWAVEGQSLKLTLKYHQNIPVDLIKSTLEKDGFTVLESIDHGHLLTIQTPARQLDKLIKKAYISSVEVIAEPGKPESDDGRNLHFANAIDGDFYGALNYDGTGVNIAINDDGAVGPHIDFKGRLNQQNVGGINSPGGTHGDMTTGIAGGAGNLDPRIRGMATGSYIHVRNYVSNMSGTEALHQDSAVLVFSTSYSNGCNAGYTNTTALVDQEIVNNPTLMQVFSAGNSNNFDCGYGAGTEWGNVTGGHKIGKNVIATANLDNNNVIVGTSSRGPASDGRIKPDIAAHGRDQMSTDPDNTYAPGGGTSAAAPGIAGVLAQLHQAYRELNNGNTASSALLKSTIMVTADDLGNPGPDFIYGWGKINGLAAVEVLENNQYFSNAVGQGNTNTHQIQIPAGVLQARIMVYWVDKEASTSAATALVNDLDAVVISPSNSTHQPWVLDHTPNATTLALPATTGADHLNNVEEIAIDLPIAGAYDLEVTGTTVPFGSQEYYVVYEFLTDEITVTHPMGGEGLFPGTPSRIHWSTFDNNGDFTIEYTEDNGTTWQTLTTNEPGDSRFYVWNVPNTITGQARVRVSRSGASDESDANFSIVERPQNLHIDRVCTDSNYIRLEWNPVPGATGYDVFKLGQKFMDSIGSTTDLFYNVPVNNVNDTVWLSARATGPNGLRSIRQIAHEYNGTLNGQDCYIGCGSQGNDAGISDISSPAAVVENCSGSNQVITVSTILENIGNANQTNFDIFYQLDNQPVVTETFTGNLTPTGTIPFNFSTTISISTQGTYTLKIWTGLTNDDAYCNDTLIRVFTVNFPDSDLPFEEDYESPGFPPATGTVVNNDNDITWEKVLTAGMLTTNTNAMYIENFVYDANGEEDIFKMIPVDLGQIVPNTDAYLTFDVAYARYNSNFFDALRVDLSDDCGSTFNQIYYKSGLDLATSSDVLGAFAPIDDQDWRTDSIDLSAYIGNTIIVRFVNINGYGNNMYLDNINIDGTFMLGLDSQSESAGIKVVPNPASEATTVHFQTPLTEQSVLEVINQNGQIITRMPLNSGTNTETIDLSDFAPGVYYLRIKNNNAVLINKLIVE